MSDKEKLALIDKIVADALEWCISPRGAKDGFVEGTLYAVSSVIVFGEEG